MPSVVILATILLLSCVLKDEIQVVLDFTGGIFGIFILFVMPCVEVHCARKRRFTEGSSGSSGKLEGSLPIFVGVLGLGFMGLNLYNIISKMRQ